MRSLIILEVEHGEDVDTLNWIIEQIHEIHSAEKIVNYTVRVDLPECFRLDD